MFPVPWDAAYERLLQIQKTGGDDRNPKTRVFLRHWLSEQGNLPRLSRDAVLELVRNMTFEYCAHWDECLAILDPYADEIRSLEKANRDDKEQREQKAKNEGYAKKQAMFSYPWDTAYEACDHATSWEGAQLWLRKWLKEQTALPPISVAAAEELMKILVDEETLEAEDETYCGLFSLFSPYLDTGYLHNVSSYNLEKKLPEAWFCFWKEIKDYPDRRNLFVEKSAKYSSDPPHPVFEEPLTVDQATLLSRALGRCEIDIKSYAYDLTKCVVMTAERGGKMGKSHARSHTSWAEGVDRSLRD